MARRIVNVRTGIVVLAISFVLSGLCAPSVSAATRKEVGMSTSATLLRMKPADLIKRLDDMKQLGVTWIRVDFSWSAIQPDNSHDYQWDMYDMVVDQATARKLKILAILDYTPAWAREPRCAALVPNEDEAQKCNPRSAEEFGHFAGMVAERYKTKYIRGWEIWNEPNLAAYWKTVQVDNSLAPDSTAYAACANAAAAHIRAHSVDSVIITGGLSPMFEPQYPTGARQSDYLAELLPKLDADLFDGVAIHPYTWPILPTKPVAYNAFHTVDNGKPDYNLRTVMQHAGWGDKEIWGTEFGASTKGLRSVNLPLLNKRLDHVSEDKQAQITEQGIIHWYQKDNVGPLFVHSDSDEWLVERKNEGGFGLRRSDGSKKPAYDAFRRAARQVE
jgi:polysaccharide biosynthesis protein PslG